MVRRAAVQNAQVNIGARGLREALEKVLDELGLKIANAAGGNFGVHHAVSAAAQINGGGSEGIVHGHQEISGAQDAAFRTERLADCFAEGDANVFDRVVLIDVEVAFRGERQIESAVTSDEIEHVVEEANTSGDARFAATVEIEAESDVGLVGLAMDASDAWHVFLHLAAAPRDLDGLQQTLHFLLCADADADEAGSDVPGAIAKENAPGMKFGAQLRAA